MRRSAIETLKKGGWESTKLKGIDRRQIQQLQPVGKLADFRARTNNHQFESGSDTDFCEKKHKRLAQSWYSISKQEGNRNEKFGEALEKFQKNMGLDIHLPALQAAKKSLRAEHPHMYENMSKSTEYLKIKRSRLKKHFDSLGIFDPATNIVRTRTIYRVEMSHACSRAKLRDKPQDFRDMDIDWSDTLAGRLERLYQQVLDTVNVHNRRRRKCFVDDKGKMKRFLAIASERSPRLLQKPLQIEEPSIPCGHRLSQLSRERIEERESQIAAAQEAHIGRYHDAVAEKRNKILRDMGVDPDAPWTVELVLTKLEEHLRMRCEKGEGSLCSDRESSPESGSQQPGSARNNASLVYVALKQIETAQALIDACKDNNTKTQALLKNADVGLLELPVGSEASISPSSSFRSFQSRAVGETQSETAEGLWDETMDQPLESDGIRPRRLQPGQHPFDRDRGLPTPSVSSNAQTGDASARTVDSRNSAASSDPVPTLPEIRVQTSHGQQPAFADALALRLERLWLILKIPMVARIDMVIKYTSDPMADNLEEALDEWDSAAAAVLHRENLLGRLVAVQKAVKNATCASINLPMLKTLSVDFLKTSERVHEMKKRLFDKFDDCLLVDGEPYPGPGEIQPQDMELFLTWVAEHDAKKPTKVNLSRRSKRL